MAGQKDRENRRQRIMVEQQAQAYEVGLRMQRDLFIDTISHQSNMETKLSQRFWQLKAEADGMKKNREIREKQYASYRQRDSDENLRRELLIWRW